MRDALYPFAAIVGQENVKRALLLALVNPRIGGVLLCGEKGTAKSTIVRAAGELTNMRVVDLPLNTTEDMLIGSIDFEETIKTGERCFMGGILSRANGGILYVDEINLLSDGVAAEVVCAAASGENLVEREGVSHRHECRFVLIGTMNPEEGGLRPQLLDKFGLYVSVAGERDVDARKAIIRERMDFERDSAAYIKKYRARTEKLKAQLLEAQKTLKSVKADESVRRVAAKLAENANAEGNRAELLLIETAAACAALDMRKYITIADIKEAAEFVLPHRKRDAAPPNGQSANPSEDDRDADEDNSQNADNEDNENNDADGENESAPQYEGKEDNARGDDNIDAKYDPDATNNDAGNESDDELVSGDEVYAVKAFSVGRRDRIARKGAGHRKKTVSSANKGRCAGFLMSKTDAAHDVALDATLRAAAPYQAYRQKRGCAVSITDSDLRYKRREDHIGMTLLFVVDASGSMGANKRMKATKEAILSLLMDSYQKRDKVGLIAFRKTEAQLLLNITRSVDLAEKELQSLPTGGRTPLADGLFLAWETFRARRLKDPYMLPLVVLVTDGRANCARFTSDPVQDAYKAAALIKSEGIRAVVIDTENDFISFHLAEKVANEMGAAYFKVNELKSEQLRGIVALSRNGLSGAEAEAL